MTKIYQLGTPSKEALGVETYLAPAPPSQGKIIVLDCDPDTSTAAVFVGQTPHDARKVGSRENLGLQALLGWAARSSGRRISSCWTPVPTASSSAPGCTPWACARCFWRAATSASTPRPMPTMNKMAAAPIALVYLPGNAPCVWVPDERSRQRRELLHAYRKAVEDHTAAGNSLRAFLNGNGIRPAQGQARVGEHPSMDPQTTGLVALQSEILAEHFGDLDACKERRKRLYRLIAAEMSVEPLMLRSMKALGVGKKGRGDNPTISSSEALRPFSAIAAPRPGANGAGNSSPEKATAMSPSPPWLAISWSRSGTCSRATPRSCAREQGDDYGKESETKYRRHSNGNAAPRLICHSRVAHSAYCAPKGTLRNIAASQRRIMPLLNGRNKR
jgi:hypothetical protein